MQGADNRFSKLFRVVKAEADLAALNAYIQSEYTRIKEIFYYYAAMSNFPTISWLDFSNMC